MKKRKAGAPPKYKTPEELQEKIEDYFKNGIALKKILVGPTNNRTVEEIPVPTITGLILHCGFADRTSFYDMEKLPGFSYTIKKARAAIEQIYEELLHTPACTGAIFALKNFNWKDKTEIEHGLSENLIEKFSTLTTPDLIKKLHELTAGK
jgi:hypothetical protein